VQVPLVIINTLLGLITFSFLLSGDEVGSAGLIYALPMLGFLPVSLIYYLVVGTYLAVRVKVKSPKS
jgi:hypothetical protein